MSPIIEIIKRAGAIALEHYGKLEPEMKGNKTYVTAADLAVQAFIVQELEKHFPDDGIIGEEEGQRKEHKGNERYWIVDPIDGTASFVRGFPVWGVSIGLLEKGRPSEGYFYMPVVDELYHTREDGVYLNDERVFMPKPKALHNETLIMVTTVAHRKRRLAAAFPGQINCHGAGAAHLSYVASGAADGIWLEGAFAWDIAAGLAMLLKNGGVLKQKDGTDFDLTEWLFGEAPPYPIFGGRPEMFEMLRKYLE